MRYLYAVLAVLVVFSVSTAVFAEEAPAAPAKTKVITTDLFDLMLGIPNAEYEMTVQNHAAALAFRLGSGGADLGDWSWSILMLGSSYRGYFGKQAPSGGYWGAGLDIWMIDAEQTTLGVTAKGDATFIGPKAEIGYQYVSGGGFTFGTGLALIFLSGSLKVGNEEFPLSGLGADIRLSLGYAF